MTRYASGSVMKRGAATTPKTSAAETTSTTHPSVDVMDSGVAVVSVVVSATSGTPTMTVVVEGSTDGTTFVQLGVIGANGYQTGSVGTAPSNITTTGTYVGIFAVPQVVRTRSVIAGGTPSLTYSVLIEAGGG
jgi:hypothetical protein